MSSIQSPSIDWSNAPSINAQAAPLIDALIADVAALRLRLDRDPSGCVLVDAGIHARGGIEAGRRIAEICMAGLGAVRIQSSATTPHWPASVHVHSADPVMACLVSQYAGWGLSHGQGKGAFQALGSGPGRALAVKEPLFAELGYRDTADATCLVLEVDQMPPRELLLKISADCGIAPERLTIVVTPTRSLAGTTQIVARVLEVALHKTHELGFPLARVEDGVGAAPLPPPGSDFLTAMGRTNDAILFGGEVHLFVRGSDDDARQLAEQLPSSASRDYGRCFADVFAAYEYDFFKIDPMLFSPALVRVSNLDTGASFRAGRLNMQLLEGSFGGL